MTNHINFIIEINHVHNEKKGNQGSLGDDANDGHSASLVYLTTCLLTIKHGHHHLIAVFAPDKDDFCVKYWPLILRREVGVPISSLNTNTFFTNLLIYM